MRFIILILVCVVTIGCAESPVGPSAVTEGGAAITGSSGSESVASTAGLLGGLDLDGYCRSIGYEKAMLKKPQVGLNAAFGNWHCQGEGEDVHPVSLVPACQWQYGAIAVRAHPADKNDAYTWLCYDSVG
jgi:hypothetical protein